MIGKLPKSKAWKQSDSGRASALEQTRAEKPHRGGLPIGREALRPSEPHHSPNKATPSYYTKNETFASEISM
jgi:hypothetical protein